MKITKADEKLIDAEVARKLREDSTIGRWVRLTFPDRFEAMLKRARQDLKHKREEHTRRSLRMGEFDPQLAAEAGRRNGW